MLIVITGAGVTNPALLDHDPGEAYVSQHVGLVRPSDQQLSVWLLLCLMADAGGRAELVERAYGAGKPGLNLDNIRSLSVPLPPLAEQHRIVAKVDELMALCDRLEASLIATCRYPPPPARRPVGRGAPPGKRAETGSCRMTLPVAAAEQILRRLGALAGHHSQK